MKDLMEVIGGVVAVLLGLGIAFLFTGEPDLWDKMHAAAMAHFEQEGGAS